MASTYTLDPTSESATNVAVDLESPSTGIRVIDISFPPPSDDPLEISSADTIGNPRIQNRHGNREIPIRVRCNGSNLRARVRDLQKKVGKLRSEGGTFKRTLSDGTLIVFDVIGASINVPADWYFENKTDVMVDMTLTCKPYGRGAEITLTDHAETTLPVVIGVDTGVKGDIPGIARLIIDNDQAGVDQYWAVWGVESRNYSGSATAALFYEAESRLIYGTAVRRALGGASGGTVVQGTATTVWQAVMSTTDSAGTAYASHVGDFQVYARVIDYGGPEGGAIGAGTIGNLKFALEYAQGDFLQVTQNDPAYAPVTGTACVVNLGQVHLSRVAQGAQRWQGRMLVKGTDANQAYSIDHFFLIPIAEGSGYLSAVPSPVTPTVFRIADSFASAPGLLSGRAIEQGGGNWTYTTPNTSTLTVSGGSVINTGGTACRDGIGSFVRAGTVTIGAGTAAVVQVDLAASFAAGTMAMGLKAFAQSDLGVGIHTQVTTTGGGYGTISINDGNGSSSAAVPMSMGTRYTLREYIDATGRTAVWWYVAGASPGDPILKRAVGITPPGTAFGLTVLGTVPGTAAISLDNYFAGTAVPDAAIFAQQSAEIRWDSAIREDASGSVWMNPSVYVGDYLRVPPAGVEARSLRTIVKACRNDPASGADSGIDDISYQIKYQPMWLEIPET